jgi:hypothetical protein
MSRAAGKKSNLARQPVPGTPEGDEIGLSTRQDPAGSPIPGQTGNILNYPTVEQQPAVPDETFDEYRGMMAHGVPNASETTVERGLMERDGTLAKQHRPPSPPELATEKVTPTPIPVYVVEPSSGGKPLGTMTTGKITIPASTGFDPVRIASRDFNRTAMYLMVETAAGSAGAAPTGIRIDKMPSVISAGYGALVRAGGATYQKLDNEQEELFALSNDGSAVTLSVIYLFDEASAG